MAARVHMFTFSGWSWSAVIAGVITSLIFQVLLVMIGFGLVQSVRVHRYAEVTSGRGALF